MIDNWQDRVLKEMAEKQKERQAEIERNPLSQYSTSQLKEELRRRKHLQK
jgi:hypothetical protein